MYIYIDIYIYIGLTPPFTREVVSCVCSGIRAPGSTDQQQLISTV